MLAERAGMGRVTLRKVEGGDSGVMIGAEYFQRGYTHPKMKPGADAFPNRSGHL
jgi:hypothetical protein